MLPAALLASLKGLLDNPLVRAIAAAIVGLLLVFAAYKVGHWRGDSYRSAIVQAEAAQKAQAALEADSDARVKQALEASHLAAVTKDLNDYVASSPTSKRECLSGSDADSLRALWR
jgi:hypothetical protein